MIKFIAFVFAASLLAQPTFAADNDRLIGTWKLVSNNYEVQANGDTGPTMGENPVGYINFTPDRVFVVFSSSTRRPAKTDQERAALLNSLTAYTGAYHVDGNTWTTDVDVAWTPEFTGTAQKREFKIEGDRLKVVTTWRVNPNFPDKGMTRGVLTFERSK